MTGRPAIDLAGQRFGRLAVLERGHHPTQHQAYWVCLCDCDTVTLVAGYRLRSGRSTSCGCRTAEDFVRRSTSHGLRNTPEYAVWRGIKARCLNHNNVNYPRYGGRGITCCAAWLDSFEAFYRHVGPRPSDDYSIDRIDNDGNYEPGNVRWALPVQQHRNRRDNVRVDVAGSIVPLPQAVDDAGGVVSLHLAQYRMAAGWPSVEALTSPADRKRTPHRK